MCNLKLLVWKFECDNVELEAFSIVGIVIQRVLINMDEQRFILTISVGSKVFVTFSSVTEIANTD